jgi:transcriptional regulator with XRE-family HTH domain
MTSYNSLLDRQSDAAQSLRRDVGIWLREERKRAGYSQTDLAKKLGLEYYTFISQIENGRGRIPSSRYADWADALNISRREFALRMVKYYDPHTYELIVGYDD